MRRPRQLLVGLAAAAALMGCSGKGDDGTTVVMTDELRFEPARVTVRTGETVAWVNESGAFVHNVTAYSDRVPADGFFASGGYVDEVQARDEAFAGNIGGQQRYELTFDRPGRYEYFCVPHEGRAMRGVVIVEG